ncbi:hypothetical protein LWC34_39015 [Kibdelosporangium philippinense]|uniref:Uncharacterized protein n=1 Tax=Kibdelosporangium philippinense TaxID=211113 RepID=A0ABS8ZMF6_9PSEU|nr:hypothetical protein [Kibdelosporangium philippinense]MCE7008762.1 hypothetical protein [Kibdelosporangium philippinense]
MNIRRLVVAPGETRAQFIARIVATAQAPAFGELERLHQLLPRATKTRVFTKSEAA